MSLINFIIPCYNCSETVEVTINSVINVFSDEAFILCIDDGSSDDTLLKLKSLSKKFDNLKILSVKDNAGPGFARNLGLREITGWVSFLDADDIILPSFYSFYKKILENSDKNNLYVAGYEVHKKGRKLFEFYPPSAITETGLLKQCPISCLSTVFYNDPKLHLRFGDAPREDLEFWYNLLFKNDFKFRCIELVVGVYNLSVRSRSSDTIKSAWFQYKTISKYLGKPWYKSIIFTLLWMCLGWQKYRAIGRNAKF
jgi:teichuronic acid biosynthesis glycosyltransferase TuaG